MIHSFADKQTQELANGIRSRKLPPDIQQPARRKLRQLDTADRLDDLRIPRGNRLEQLKGLYPSTI